MVDLPAPVWPTRATVSPGRTTRFTPDSASCGCPEYLNRTPRNSIWPRGRPTGRRCAAGGGRVVTVEALRQLLRGGEDQVDVQQVGDQPAGRQRLVALLAGGNEQDE